MSTQRQAQLAAALAESQAEPPAWWVATEQEVNGSALHFGAAKREPWDYVPVPPFAVDDDGYLICDSMGQNERHSGRMLAYGTVLKEHLRGRAGMVGVDLTMPYVKGSPGKVLAPDLFVALAAEAREVREGRNSYKLWEEPMPDFVFEDLSPGNWRRDAVDKRELYQRFGIREYFMFDETARHLRDDSGSRMGVTLVGYRLRDGQYERIRANDAGRLPSDVLELEICERDGLVRFYDPTKGEYLRTYGEAEAQIAEEAAGRVAAEQRAEAAEERAGMATQRIRAEQAKTDAALARVAALEAELKALRDSG